MEKLSAKLGFWASIISIGAFVVFTVCFIAILLVNKPFVWTGIIDLANYEGNSHTSFKYIAMAGMILFACLFVILTICVGDTIPSEKKLLANIAVLFALAFCVTICINYFVQLTATRLQLQNGMTDGLVQFTQNFNISAINAINMLGWTLFYALSTLFLSFVFEPSQVGHVIKWFCLANTTVMCIGLIGYFVNNYLILALCMNLGLGATTFGLIIPIAIRFRNIITQ